MNLFMQVLLRSRWKWDGLPPFEHAGLWYAGMVPRFVDHPSLQLTPGEYEFARDAAKVW